jgi:hypothetical protein
MEIVKDIKEKLAIHGLPSMVIRLFGDVDYEAQLGQIPEKFRSKVVVLTTNDTPKAKVLELKANGWEVIHSARVDQQEARLNSAMLLNEAVDFLKERDKHYAFFLSSGFQRHTQMYYSMLEAATKRHRNLDAYYFILPETHTGVSLASHQQTSMDNMDEFLAGHFPYETALVMNLSTMPRFETQLSAKGNLGDLNEKTPLGGMEFFMTMLQHYDNQKRQGVIWSPKMIGISLPVPTRAEAALEFYSVTRELPVESLSRLPEKSLEVTSSEQKLA